MGDISLNRNVDVFISYSSKDEQMANLVVEGLSERGVHCWKAGEYTINSGEDFRQKIAEALDECKIFLIILSESSMASPWCKLELTEALRKNKKIYSLKVDGSPIDELFDFKLGCSQTSDGTKNLIPVVENLSINIKKERDAILEREKTQIYATSKAFYLFDLFKVNAIMMCLFLAVMIFHTVNFFSSNAEFLAEEEKTALLFVSLSGFIISVFFALMMMVIFNVVYKGQVKANADINCPSAEYLMFKLNFKLLSSKEKKEKALNYLQRSAKGGDYRALNKLAGFLEQGKFMKKDLSLAQEYRQRAKEEKANRFEKMTAQKKSISTGIVYFLLLIFIYVCSYFLFGFYIG